MLGAIKQSEGFDFVGTSAPTNPFPGMRWLEVSSIGAEIDLWIWSQNHTRWLSSPVQASPNMNSSWGSAAATPTTLNFAIQKNIPANGGVFFETAAWVVFLQGSHNVSNNFSWTFNYVDFTGASSPIGSVNTQSVASGVATNLTINPNLFVAASSVLHGSVTIVRTGAPATIGYRTDYRFRTYRFS